MRAPSLLYKTASLLNERRLDVLVGTVVLTADMEAHNGTLDEHGKPDTDFVSASADVHISP
ncbi:hypothetical protein WK11_07795 [Burkholderia ubonensis]|uniref:hypothetical protein n=1 Tax=Burkholderia ubonensis TaxID=101571 RepID=UPI00075D2412|nr:hypothetical protein [Burkholderia ubonensis]KVH76923.1 hypothetical protein WJ41_05625 [Burkholderia ubonensis]KVM03621.1 hypothetical protein WJ51_31945 [Burkholderia ubonensis]KVN98292.1 hypothetical protein WJ69_34630 [Burkholderia ubonensis]KVO01988.1 hypothetical protein WJ71_18305 [Burkholderia ubonensis]KVO14780.1 hypothetical protein WJ73_13345 [Burkholderia ubonensis]